MKIVGIDLAGSIRRETGWVLIEDTHVLMKVVYKNSSIVREVLKANPFIVTIDAPLSMPKEGHIRSIEKKLLELGISSLPPLFSGMRKLTERGILVKYLLSSMGFDVFEVYPYSLVKILGVSDRSIFLLEARRRGYQVEGDINRHTIDAFIAAIIGKLYLENKAYLFESYDGAIILPKENLNMEDIF